MFSRLEQIALRELIEGRERMLARVDALEARLEALESVPAITNAGSYKEGKRQAEERRRGKS